MADRATLDAYAANVDAYAALEATEPQTRALARFLDALPRDASILDLGCGPGLQAAAMQARGHRVRAIDASPAFVEAARDRGVAAELATFDALGETAAYDAVWASFSLLHVPRSALPQHLAAAHRALKPNGLFFLGMKTGEGEERDRLGRFYAYHSEAELRDHLETAGFRIMHSETGAERGLAGTVSPFVLIHARA